MDERCKKAWLCLSLHKVKPKNLLLSNWLPITLGPEASDHIGWNGDVYDSLIYITRSLRGQNSALVWLARLIRSVKA